MEKTRAGLFDAYGTLFDVCSVGVLARLGTEPTHIGQTLRDVRLFSDTRKQVVSSIGIT